MIFHKMYCITKQFQPIIETTGRITFYLEIHMTELDKIEELSNVQTSIEALLKYLDINAKDLSGEIALWQSVVMQAVLDATSIPKDIKSKIERARTMSWFSLNNEDNVVVFT
jgi:hypothetical protein